MRETFVKTSKGLLTLTTLGIMSILLGFLYFIGVASSNRLLLGFDYKILIAFGIYLILITVLPVLSGMDARAKTSVKKISPHLILLVCVSILGLIYSALVYGIYVTPFDVQHSWIDYFTISATFLILGILPLVFAIKDRDRLWNFKFVYFLLIIIGIFLEIAAVLVYGHYLDTLIQLPDIGWDALFLSGGVLILLGILPLLIGASSNLRDFFHTSRLLWIGGIVISFALIILSLALQLDKDLALLNTEWFVWFSFGSLLLFVTTSFLSSSREFSDTLNKLRIIWYITLLLGVIMFIISLIIVASFSPEITNIISLPDNLIGYTWDFYFMYGAVLSFFSMIIINSIIYFETEEVSGDVASGFTTDSFRDLKTTPSEMVTYLEILSKSEAELINQFKEAVREDKFRPRVYETLLRQYENRIRSYKSKISSIRKEPSRTGTADKVGAIFDSALGEASPSKHTAKSPPLPPVVPKPTSSTTLSPPPPAMPAPSIPKSEPKATPPPMPSPSIAPPSPVSSDSVLTPSPSSDSPLDLVADARSTSIAELRGEMLKELRRLREIFKEE